LNSKVSERKKLNSKVSERRISEMKLISIIFEEKKEEIHGLNIWKNALKVGFEIIFNGGLCDITDELMNLNICQENHYSISS
jgi:hypothetical protein